MTSTSHKGVGVPKAPSFLAAHRPLVTRMCHYNFVMFLEKLSFNKLIGLTQK
jgi:hypothetical protein